MADHAIVTSVDGGYSKYLPEWAAAVAALDRQPDQVVIVDNGADDPDAVAAAAEATGAEVVATGWHLHRARARNIAVAASRTEWVQHLDVDDLPEPWALSDTDLLRDDADVVSWGWTRYRGGRRTVRERLYTAHRGPSTLKSPAPASAVSPFRRRLWEQSPYRDDMDGSWDTALWIGFAHLDARFVPTQRPCYLYRWHPDSLFRARSSAHKHQLGLRLEQLRWDRPDDVAVVVPLRTDDPDRLAAADWLQAWYADHFPGWRWVVADCDGDWNKPRALNATVEATDARVLVVTDADLYVDPRALRDAVAAAGHAPWVVPHGNVHRLSRQATADVYAGKAPDPNDTVMNPYRGVDGGGLFVLTRQQWLTVGGMDDTFQGWGCEDEAFALAANTMLGERLRGDTPLWHLYHDPGPRTRHDRFKANKALLRHYRQASGNRTAMAQLIGEVDMGDEATYVNTRTGRTVRVEVGSSAWARFERLVAYGRRYERLSKPPPGQDSDTVGRKLDEQAVYGSQGVDAPKTLGSAHFEHVGGGWYEIRVDGEVVDKVRGKEAAEAAVADA